jgi:indolepyruvate ferredoxin oxidoreductase beta subunit
VTVSSGQAEYPADAEERLRSTFPRLVYVDAVGVAEKLGEVRAANVVILGALSTALSLPAECWSSALAQSVKPKYLGLNERAFSEGARLASSA